MNVYFDNAATTAVRSEAYDVMTRVMTAEYGNPSSMHGSGRSALSLLEQARGYVAQALRVPPVRIYFTSGGTEANNLAVFGSVYGLKQTGKYLDLLLGQSPGHLRNYHIITSAIEHSSVLKPINKLEEAGFSVTYLQPDNAGRITAEAFCMALRSNTVFASVMLVNNETGSVNPVSGYATEIKRQGLCTLLHTDAVQGFCKIPFSVKSLGADLVSVSSHKLQGPKGAGALYAGDRTKLSPLLLGGSQEDGKRAGTEALPAIAGFGEAARLGLSELDSAFEAVQDLRGYTAGLIEKHIRKAVIIGEGDSPYILCFSLPGFKGEVLLNYLDSNGICVSKGSACKKGMQSTVLKAMNLRSAVIDGALRVSFSPRNTREEADYFVKTLKTASETLLH